MAIGPATGQAASSLQETASDRPHRPIPCWTRACKDRISAEAQHEGDTFQTRVTSDLRASDGDERVPEGALITGRITGIDESKPVGDQAAVCPAFDAIYTWDQTCELDAEILETGGGDAGWSRW